MKTHCTIGARILAEDSKAMKAFLTWRGSGGTGIRGGAPNPILQMASSIALSHHERWDGRGYPSGARGEEIPLEARIVALADVYDALLSNRPYKRALSESETLDIIRRERGRHLDPRICDVFEDLIHEFRTIRSEFSDDVCRTVEAGCAT